MNYAFYKIFALFLISNLSATLHERKKLIEYGDLMIGALLPVHEQPSYNEEQVGPRRKCGIIRDQYGVQRVEALLFMLDIINNKSITNLLPGVKLGLEIRDECWDSSIALEETIDFIKDTIASEVDHNGEEKSELHDHLSITKNHSIKLVNSKNSMSEKCQILNKEKENQNKILAVIGPGGSSVSINVQNLLQLFDIPQIGYSATSRDLSDKKLFKTFLRVVPSDYLQVRAIVDVVNKMNWTYIFAIHTDGSYGQAGMDSFRNEISSMNICIALYEKIREYANLEDYELVIKKMNKTTKARVIVCFCYGETIRGLLAAINKLNLKGRFIILGSDGWSDRIDVAKDYYEEAVGSLSFKAYSPKVIEFNDYFTSLNPTNNKRNVWFNEYWEEMFKCYINEPSIYKTPCKRKCPSKFVNIENNCYWFSTSNLNWLDAQNLCKEMYFNSDILDINDQEDLAELVKHLLDNRLSNYLKSLHIKIKLPDHDLTNYSDEMHNDYVENLKLKLCNSNNQNTASTVSKDKNGKSTSSIYHSTLSEFEASLANENVVTYFIGKANSDLANISIKFSSKDNSYCVDMRKSQTKLPFICKYKTLKNNKTSTDFYPDSLRNYQQDPKMSYVINSLFAIVHGLDKAHQIFCNGTPGLCEKLKKINGSTLLKFIKNSSFFGVTGEKIYFDSNGDPPGRYVILNVQKEYDLNENLSKYVYKEVGSWNNDDKLTIDLDAIVFPGQEKKFSSTCSEQCSFGHVKQIKKGDHKCCWNCKKCEDHAYMLDEYTCQECDKGFWPNVNLTGCEKLQLTYLNWTEPSSLIALSISIIGILINTFIVSVFIKYSNTCVVKSTTKELSFIILSGVYLCYLTTIPLVLRPSLVTCYFTRVMPGFSLSLMYSALIVKTNRIARILARSKKRILTKKLRFMSLTAQIVITLIIIGVECVLIIASFILEPKCTEINFPTRNVARLECFNDVTSVIMPLGYNMILVVLCTLYAVKTRNIPENFNEAKFIGFSMYTTCVIWIAFTPLYFGSDFKVITLSISTSFSATVILVFLFCTKVYIILFEPEKNQRSAFATSKDLRCHFGSSNIDNDRNSSIKRHSSTVMEKINMQRRATLQQANQVFQNEKKVENDMKKKPKININESLLRNIDRSCQTSIKLLETSQEKETRKNLIQKPIVKNFNTNNHQDESNLADCFSTDSSSEFKELDQNNNKIALKTSSIIDNDFLKKMQKEDESLEEFKDIFLKKQNLIVNWDYVQSSDYL